MGSAPRRPPEGRRSAPPADGPVGGVRKPAPNAARAASPLVVLGLLLVSGVAGAVPVAPLAPASGAPTGPLPFAGAWSGSGSPVPGAAAAPLPTVEAESSVSVTDVGLPISFHAVPSGGVGPFTFSWSFGDGTGATGNATTHAYGAPGVRVVEVVAQDADGARVTANVTVEIDPLPTVSWNATPVAPRAGAPVSFAAQAVGGTGALELRWTFGDGANATGPTPTHVFAAGGTYHVTVQVVDSVGGTGASSADVVVGSGAPGSAPGGVPPSRLEVLALGGVALAGALTAGVILLERHRRRTAGVPPPPPAPVDGDLRPR